VAEAVEANVQDKNDDDDDDEEIDFDDELPDLPDA
jgi:hypothetical protein